LLTERGVLPNDAALAPTCERIKEKYCYVAKDFALESAAIRRAGDTHIPLAAGTILLHSVPSYFW
jgi:hypothetical protein